MKTFRISADQIKPLAMNRGGCIASDMITVDGLNVGYMYREHPSNSMDSGWRFLSGHESQDYMNDSSKHSVYDVNTLANYDPDIIQFLDSATGSEFERVDNNAALTKVIS